MDYKFDIFLSYNSLDREKVRELARQLKDSGLKVWFDEWNIKPGEDIFSSIEKGLELSKVMLFFMTSNAFSSDWVELEKNTIIFRDPANKKRRFVPILLEPCKIPDTIKRFKYIDATEKITQSKLKEIIYSLDLPVERLDNIKLGQPLKADLIKDAEAKLHTTKKSTNDIDINWDSIRENIIEKILNIEKESKSLKRPSYLIYLDIDGFTLINTKFGYDAGDEILKQIQLLIHKTIPNELVERWGADEYICCTKNIEPNKIESVCNSIVESIAKYNWQTIAPDLFVSISLGFSKLKQSKAGEDSEHWFERAIIGSYYSKREGGNTFKEGPKYIVKKKHPHPPKKENNGPYFQSIKKMRIYLSRFGSH